MRFLPFLLCCLFLAAAILPRPASAALRPERLAYGKHGKAVRWHIVALYIDCAMSVTAIAAMLNGKTRKKLINAKTVQRILEIFRTTSDVKTPKKGARPTRKIKVPAVVWNFIMQSYALEPDLFLDEVQALVKTNYNYTIPISTLCRNLNNAGLTVRVLQQRSIDRDLQAERDWAHLAATHDPRMFIFIDYIHPNPRKRKRRRGRGWRGSRTMVFNQWCWGQRLNVFAAISLVGKKEQIFNTVGCLGGVIFHRISRATANSDTALACISAMIDDGLVNKYDGQNPNSVICLDNATYFQDQRIQDVVEAVGARLMFIPKGAKENNPIEESFSKVQASLARNRALANDDPVDAVRVGLESITHYDAEGYYRHAGWTIKRSIDTEAALLFGCK